MIPSGLDAATQQLLMDILHSLHQQHRQQVLAVFLYGSVARHEERPLDDPEPSDVDILVMFDTNDPYAPYDWGVDVTLGGTYQRHITAPRDVNVMFGTRDLSEWDVRFIENVAREGILLYGENCLPKASTIAAL